MYKLSQQRQDWMARVGSHATRERFSVNALPTPRAQFENGALPELKDRRARLLVMMHGMTGRAHQAACKQLSVLNADIKRLNREASETYERAMLWAAAKECLPPEMFELLSATAHRMRMEAEGHSAEAIADALSARLSTPEGER